MKPSQILKNALELLGPNGEHWAKGWYYKTKDGEDVEVVDINENTCFCAFGAMRQVLHRLHNKSSLFDNPDLDQYRAAGIYLSNQISGISFAPWQDEPGRTFGEVKEKILAAIVDAERDEQKAA